MGRPTDNPKTLEIKFRADEETNQLLNECSNELKISKSEVLRRGVHRIHDDLKK